jgi:hypothetical protein
MTTTKNPVASAPMHPVVGQPMYAVFGRHVSRGITQMSIPLTLDEAKRFMKFAKCYMFYTKRRIRRLPNTVMDRSPSIAVRTDGGLSQPQRADAQEKP